MFSLVVYINYVRQVLASQLDIGIQNVFQFLMYVCVCVCVKERDASDNLL